MSNLVDKLLNVRRMSILFNRSCDDLNVGEFNRYACDSKRHRHLAKKVQPNPETDCKKCIYSGHCENTSIKELIKLCEQINEL